MGCHVGDRCGFAAGAGRVWYVRLWAYAEGSPTDAQVTLPFSQLAEGWLADGGAVHPGAIERMFISLVAPAYVSGSTVPAASLSAPTNSRSSVQ